MRGSRNIELTHLKKQEEEVGEEEEKQFGHFGAVWLGTFMILFCATRSLVGCKHTRRWMVRCYKINAYRFTVFEI